MRQEEIFFLDRMRTSRSQERPKIPPEEGKKKELGSAQPVSRSEDSPQQNFVYVGRMEPKREKHKNKKTQSPDGVFLWGKTCHSNTPNSTFLRLLFSSFHTFLSADRLDPQSHKILNQIQDGRGQVRHASVCSTNFCICSSSHSPHSFSIPLAVSHPSALVIWRIS